MQPAARTADTSTTQLPCRTPRSRSDIRDPESPAACVQVLAFAVGTATSIADPEDAGMLDVPGLDAGVPEVMRQFVLGEL